LCDCFTFVEHNEDTMNYNLDQNRNLTEKIPLLLARVSLLQTVNITNLGSSYKIFKEATLQFLKKALIQYELNEKQLDENQIAFLSDRLFYYSDDIKFSQFDSLIINLELEFTINIRKIIIQDNKGNQKIYYTSIRADFWNTLNIFSTEVGKNISSIESIFNNQTKITSNIKDISHLQSDNGTILLQVLWKKHTINIIFYQNELSLEYEDYNLYQLFITACNQLNISQPDLFCITNSNGYLIVDSNPVEKIFVVNKTEMVRLNIIDNNSSHESYWHQNSHFQSVYQLYNLDNQHISLLDSNLMLIKQDSSIIEYSQGKQDISIYCSHEKEILNITIANMFMNPPNFFNMSLNYRCKISTVLYLCKEYWKDNIPNSIDDIIVTTIDQSKTIKINITEQQTIEGISILQLSKNNKDVIYE